MFLRKAMRYYRLWIYTCNAVLLVSVLVFLAVSIVILCNPNLSLVPTPVPYHPTLLYGYLALFLQAGVLQAIGHFGAIKLCQKLLNTYWFLLLSLLLCDLLVGFIWLLRFTHLTEGLRPYIIKTLQTEYGKDRRITEAWDALQVSKQCCGSDSPMDYYNISSTPYLPFIPASCCHTISTVIPVRDVYKSDHVLRYMSRSSSSRSNWSRSEDLSRNMSKVNLSCRGSDQVPYLNGCAESIVKWYKGSAETLMIFGFCVITFVKLCFVGILRFEIQEMIQKIKILQGEANAHANPELAEALGMMCGDKITDTGGSRVRLPNNNTSEESGNPSSGTSAQLLIRHNHISNPAVDSGGTDSDTNSYCALITDTPVRNAHQAKRKQNGNNNELTEMSELRHIRQTEI